MSDKALSPKTADAVMQAMTEVLFVGSVTCPRCGSPNSLADDVNRKDVLCGNCYGPLDEAETKQADLYAAELEKLKSLTKSYGNKENPTD